MRTHTHTKLQRAMLRFLRVIFAGLLILHSTVTSPSSPLFNPHQKPIDASGFIPAHVDSGSQQPLLLQLPINTNMAGGNTTQRIINVRQHDDPDYLAQMFCVSGPVSPEGCQKVAQLLSQSVKFQLANVPTVGSPPSGPETPRSPGPQLHRTTSWRRLWQQPDLSCSESGCGCDSGPTDYPEQPAAACWPSFPHKPSADQLKYDLERLRIRQMVFKRTLHDAGPPFLKRQFRHWGHCLACDVQDAADRQVRHTRPIELGTVRQTFVDDFALASTCNIQRAQGTPIKFGEHVIRADKPWEDDRHLLYGTVLHDGNRFNLWYMPFAGTQGVAHSIDGFQWVKPELAMMSGQEIAPAQQEHGSPIVTLPDVNNVIWSGGTSLTVSADHAGGNNSYKYVGGMECNPQDHRGRWYLQTDRVPWDLCIGVSADGIHWRLVPGNDSGTSTDQTEATAVGPADSYVQVKPVEDGYLLVTRYEFPMMAPHDPNFKWRGGRGVRVLHNSAMDLTAPGAASNWTVAWRWYLDLEYGPQLEHLRRQLYCMTATLYHGVWLLMITILEWPKELSNRPRADKERVYLATSRDMGPQGGGVDLRWVYSQKTLFGNERSNGTFAQYEAGSLLPASEIVTHGNHHWIFYKGCQSAHEEKNVQGNDDCRIGLVRFRLDGLVLLKPTDDSKWGSAVTKRFVVRGGLLLLNYKASSADGQLLVAVMHPDGVRYLDGYSCKDSVPMRGDHLNATVGWKSETDLSKLIGQQVVAR